MYHNTRIIGSVTVDAADHPDRTDQEQVGGGLGAALDAELGVDQAVHDRAQRAVMPSESCEQPALVVWKPTTLVEVMNRGRPVHFRLREPTARRREAGMERRDREPAARAQNAMH